MASVFRKGRFRYRPADMKKPIENKNSLKFPLGGMAGWSLRKAWNSSNRRYLPMVLNIMGYRPPGRLHPNPPRFVEGGCHNQK